MLQENLSARNNRRKAVLKITAEYCLKSYESISNLKFFFAYCDSVLCDLSMYE